MKIVEHILKKNPCYTSGRKITVKGLMLHSVGCPQPKASAFLNNWNSADFNRACVHGFIDGNDGTVYQTLPWNHRGWHCGSSINGSANNTHIGVEMCEPACITYVNGATFKVQDGKLEEARAVVRRTYKAAVELFAMLCKEYGLNPTADGVILSHAEGHRRGIASNHGDPEHLWNQLGLGYSMDGFRRDVKAAMSRSSGATENSQHLVDGLPGIPFSVRVIIDDLNYHSEPSMDGDVKGQTGKGTFTIVEVHDGWGKLKSGVGWIWLGNPSYCTVGNSVSTTDSKKPVKTASVAEIAKEVIQGKWGNGAERKQKILAAGYDYDAVQKKVNELLK